MKNKLINYPCTCGHTSKDHYIKDGYASSGYQCWFGGEDHIGYILNACQCLRYRSDNLLYLEQRYEEKSLDKIK